MTHLPAVRPSRAATLIVVAALIASAAFVGSALAGSHRGVSPPCRDGGRSCMKIGFTDAWLEGRTVQLEYSHRFYCAQPPSSGAGSGCEGGEAAGVAPKSGPIVSEIYELVPLGFSPPMNTLHCPSRGRCIDHPATIDLSRVSGMGDANARFPEHSIVLEEDESFQSTWWPLVLVGVKSLSAWNEIASAKSVDAMDACIDAGRCTDEVDTNAFIFFQVLGPGMSTEGPD